VAEAGRKGPKGALQLLKTLQKIRTVRGVFPQKKGGTGKEKKKKREGERPISWKKGLLSFQGPPSVERKRLESSSFNTGKGEHGQPGRGESLFTLPRGLVHLQEKVNEEVGSDDFRGSRALE